jgi:hypothetical protein
MIRSLAAHCQAPGATRTPGTTRCHRETAYYKPGRPVYLSHSRQIGLSKQSIHVSKPAGIIIRHPLFGLIRSPLCQLLHVNEMPGNLRVAKKDIRRDAGELFGAGVLGCAAKASDR